jgi:putative SOS response-associated peptidase YedK
LGHWLKIKNPGYERPSSSHFRQWLSGEAGAELLRPAPNDLLQKWPVCRGVNSSRERGDDPTLIERLLEPA